MLNKRSLLLCYLYVSLCTFTSTSFAETYFVDRDSLGGKCADSHAGTSETEPWCSLDQALDTVTAGDDVNIRAGRYDEQLRPWDIHGTEDERIVFRAFDGEEVILTETDYAIDIRNSSYLTFDGLQTEQTDRYVLVRNSNFIWVHNCTLTDANNTPDGGWRVGIVIEDNSAHNWFDNNIIGAMGYSTSDDDIGGVINVGNWSDGKDQSHYNLIENNVLFHGGHHVMELASSYNIVRNNYFYNNNWNTCDHRTETGGLCGNRNVVAYGPFENVERNVFEGNIFAYSGVPADQDTSSGFSLRARHTILRHNVFHHNDSAGITAESYSSNPADPSFSRIYHNVFYHNGYNALSGIPDWLGTGLTIGHHGDGPAVTDIVVKNNIFYENRTDAIIFYYVDESTHTVTHNWEHQGDPLFVDISGDPAPGDRDAFDFHLQNESPCIDGGDFLTNAVGDGEGTELSVEDASYFTDGFGITDGDLIQLEGQIDRVRIESVDYDTNTLTLAGTLTWTDGLGVSLPFNDTSPDMGAFEYGEPSDGDADSDSDTDADGDSDSDSDSDVDADVDADIDADGDADGGTDPENEEGCNCAVSEKPQHETLPLFLLILAVCFVRLRRH